MAVSTRIVDNTQRSGHIAEFCRQDAPFCSLKDRIQSFYAPAIRGMLFDSQRYDCGEYRPAATAVL